MAALAARRLPFGPRCRTVTVSDAAGPGTGSGRVSPAQRDARVRPIRRAPWLGGGFRHRRKRLVPACQLLARLARTLSAHWKRSLAAAIGVLVLLVLAAGASEKPADDFSLPGAESQQAIDLFQAHSPAFGGVDSTLVFTVDEGRVSDPGPKAAIE